MKRLIPLSTLILLIILTSSNTFPQESKNNKNKDTTRNNKEIGINDMEIVGLGFEKDKKSTVEPIAGAKLTMILSSSKSGTITTGQKGTFGIHFSNLDEVQGKNNSTITLKITITPPMGFKYQFNENNLELVLKKSEGPYYEFTLLFQPKADSEFGNFLIKPNKNFSIMVPDTTKKGAKQGKGSAVKTGDSYQGEVMHF